MPIALRILCSALAVLLVIHACLAPFVEEGWIFLLPVTIDASLLGLLWAFSRRRQGTLSWLSIYCIVGLAFAVLFSPFSGEYGSWEPVVQVQLVCEAVVLLALYIVLRRQSTKTWFHGPSET